MVGVGRLVLHNLSPCAGWQENETCSLLAVAPVILILMTIKSQIWTKTNCNHRDRLSKSQRSRIKVDIRLRKGVFELIYQWSLELYIS